MAKTPATKANLTLETQYQCNHSSVGGGWGRGRRMAGMAASLAEQTSKLQIQWETSFQQIKEGLPWASEWLDTSIQMKHIHKHAHARTCTHQNTETTHTTAPSQKNPLKFYRSGKNSVKKIKRLDSLISWQLGPDFTSCIYFLGKYS